MSIILEGVAVVVVVGAFFWVWYEQKILLTHSNFVI